MRQFPEHWTVLRTNAARCPRASFDIELYFSAHICVHCVVLRLAFIHPEIGGGNIWKVLLSVSTRCIPINEECVTLYLQMLFICVSVTDGQLLGIGLGDIDPSRKQLSASSDGRPKSCCEVPRVPGIKYVHSIHLMFFYSVPSAQFCLLTHTALIRTTLCV